MPRRLLSENLATLTLLAAIAAYVHPPLFLPLADYFLWLFAATMFALGLVLHPEEAIDTMRRPQRIAVGVGVQYLVMPLLGLAAALSAEAATGSSALALGFVIVGCAPGAMASNVIAFLAGGALAYSIAMTLTATLLAPLLTPLLVELLGGVFLEIEPWPMMRTILFAMLLPLTAGVLLGRHPGVRTQRVEAAAPAIAALAIVAICAYAVAVNQERLAELSPWVALLVIGVNACGYLLGWLAGGLFGFDRRHRITLTVEIGMQNAGLGVALALEHFAPETALPGALFAVWCILTAAGMTRTLRKSAEAVPGI